MMMECFFIEENQNQDDFDKAFSIYQKKGKRFIKVKNYVGVIETKQGVVIEILPKTFCFGLSLTKPATDILYGHKLIQLIGGPVDASLNLFIISNQSLSGTVWHPAECLFTQFPKPPL